MSQKRTKINLNQTTVSEVAPRPALQQRVIGAILEAAAAVIAASGESASMTDVAAAAGVARATLYRYFPSRQALLDELAALAVADAEERLVAARLEEVATDEGVTRVVRALVEVGDAFIVLAASACSPTRNSSSTAWASRCAGWWSAPRLGATFVTTFRQHG